MTPPVALTIAGSDSGGGAGIQADLKTFAAHGVYGTCAVTVVTAQNTRGVQRATPLDAELVRAQIESVLDDFPVVVVKTGALGSPEIVAVVADTLRGRGLPLILDPVMQAKGGDSLLATEAVAALTGLLLPLATLVTPNLPEAETLLGLPSGWLQDAAHLQALAGYPPPFPLLLKGGHGPGEVLYDHLLLEGHTVFSAERIQTRHTHGTGCTLSAAIAARLAQGHALPEAVSLARDYLRAAILAAPGLGRAAQRGEGHGPLEHFPDGLQENSGYREGFSLFRNS